MRVFILQRDVDVTGVSGTGVVAEGVEFSDGSVVLRWLSQPQSTVHWHDAKQLIQVHGHTGSTRIIWGKQQIHAPEPQLTQHEVQEVVNEWAKHSPGFKAKTDGKPEV